MTCSVIQDLHLIINPNKSAKKQRRQHSKLPDLRLVKCTNHNCILPLSTSPWSSWDIKALASLDQSTSWSSGFSLQILIWNQQRYACIKCGFVGVMPFDTLLHYRIKYNPLQSFPHSRGTFNTDVFLKCFCCFIMFSFICFSIMKNILLGCNWMPIKVYHIY